MSDMRAVEHMTPLFLSRERPFAALFLAKSSMATKLQVVSGTPSRPSPLQILGKRIMAKKNSHAQRAEIRMKTVEAAPTIVDSRYRALVYNFFQDVRGRLRNGYGAMSFCRARDDRTVERLRNGNGMKQKRRRRSTELANVSYLFGQI